MFSVPIPFEKMNKKLWIIFKDFRSLFVGT